MLCQVHFKSCCRTTASCPANECMDGVDLMEDEIVVATFYEHCECECVCRGGLAITLYNCNLEDGSLDIPSRNSIVVAENRTERTKASGW